MAGVAGVVLAAFWGLGLATGAVGPQTMGEAQEGLELVFGVSPATVAVTKTGGPPSWLVHGYVPKGVVARWEMAGEGPARVSLWDAGRYRVEAAGRARDVRVAVPQDHWRWTAAVLAGLAAAGFACGWVGRRLAPPATGAPLPLVLAVVGGLVLATSAPAAVAAHGHGPGGAAAGDDRAGHETGLGGAPGSAFPVSAADLLKPALPETLAVPVPLADGPARLVLRHEEDGVTLLDVPVRVAGGVVRWTYTFPEGASYRAEVRRDGQTVATAVIRVAPGQPSAGDRAVGFAVLAAPYAFGLAAGVLAARRAPAAPSAAAAP
ncbi:MAG: hypothetical protein IRY95_10175 [Clostridia bacterium]|nr:hypothetical protein [Clostridia bacterium]